MIIGPCKDCINRKIGCHATCENYKDYKIKLEEEKKLKYSNSLSKCINIELYNNYKRRLRRCKRI